MNRTNPAVAAIVLVVCCALAGVACGDGDRSGADDTTTTAPTTDAGESGSSETDPEPTSEPTARPAVEPKGTTVDGTLRTPDGRDRTYQLYMPSTVTAGPGVEPVALLVGLHGGTGWGAQFQASSGFDGIAEANRFIAVYPDGVGAGADASVNRTWNGGRCCGVAVRESVDDVTFIRLLVEDLSARYPVDPARVFAAGHSNGGVLAYRLACELADVIAAIGVQSSSLEVDGCAPSRPVSVLHVHGTADRNLPIDGGPGPEALSGVDWRVPLDGAASYAELIGCPPDPARTTDEANSDLTIDAWTPCDDDTEVRFVTVDGAPHSWFGPRRPGTRPGVEVYTGLDSSAEIWAFLIAHRRG
jgi:polyhydroxybutyrate depolymerase